MTTAERIEQFQKECPPFYIVDHEDSKFSLCLHLGLLRGEHENYCQDAFNAYARKNGEPVCGKNGAWSYGSGYDWQAAFQEAFKDDPNIGKVLFDSEAGGFFCDGNDLDVIEDFGRRFKTICEDTEQFALVVAEGIRNAGMRNAESERLMNSVRGLLMRKPDAAFEIRSPLGSIRLTPEMGKKLLNGEMPTIQIEGVHYADFELLDQPVLDWQCDLFDENLIRMKTKEAPEQDQIQVEPQTLMV